MVSSRSLPESSIDYVFSRRSGKDFCKPGSLSYLQGESKEYARALSQLVNLNIGLLVFRGPFQ